MSNIPLFFLYIIFLTFSLIKFFPNNRVVFLAFHLFFCLIFFIYFLNIEKKKNGFILSKNIVVNFIFLFSLLSISFYYYNYRYSVNPIGMWDSWAMWNLKAIHIFEDYSAGYINDFRKDIFPHRDYPIGLPLVSATFFILFNSTNLIIIWFLNFIFLGLILCVLISTSKNSYTNKIISSLIICFLILFNREFMRIATDLCADLFLSLSLLVIIHSLNEFKTKNNFLILGISLSLPMWIKNEGLIFACLALFLVFFYLFSYINFKSFINLILPSTASYLLLLIFRNHYSITTTSDFVLSISFINDTSRIILTISKIIDAFYNFHIVVNYGFYLIVFIVLLILGFKFIRFSLIYLMTIILAYNIIFLFSISDLDWHISTSYNRIHIVLLPSFTYLILLLMNFYTDKNMEQLNN